jgi:hypothetical protein
MWKTNWRGTAGKALEVLLASDVSAFGREGMELELELLLKTGRAGDVAQWTTPDQKDQLGGPAYHWRRAQAMAATGHYALAQEEMTGLAEELAREAGAPNNLPLQEAMAVTVSKVVLDEQAAGESVAHRAVCAITRSILQGRVQTFENSLRQIAETRTVRGLLALEAGEVAVAKAAFLEALTIWKDESAAGRIDFNARVIAQDGLRWLR